MIRLEISDMGAMEQAARGFAQAGDDATMVLKTSIRMIDRGGTPWGGDAAGQAFWGVYRSAATLAVANASQVGPQVQVLGENTAATLAMYQANEEQAASLSAGLNA